MHAVTNTAAKYVAVTNMAAGKCMLYVTSTAAAKCDAVTNMAAGKCMS